MILPLAIITSSIGTYHHPKFSPALSHISAIVVSSIYNQEIAAAYTDSWSDVPNTPIIVYLSLSCGLNVYLTTHIVLHMIRITRTISKSRMLCNRIASMFVQSTLFYLVPTLVFIALCAQRSLGQNLFFPIICQIQASSVSSSCILVVRRHGLISCWFMYSLCHRYSSSCG